MKLMVKIAGGSKTVEKKAEEFARIRSILGDGLQS